LAIVSFLNTRDFSRLFKLYLTIEEEQDTEKDDEQFGDQEENNYSDRRF